MNFYSVCGLVVGSDMELENFTPCGAPAGSTDIQILISDFPTGQGERVSGYAYLTDDGACVLEVPRVAAYRMADGSSILVRPAAGATPLDLEYFLTAYALSLLFHQRGWLPLQASCLDLGDGALVFAGASGAGKSVTLMTLVKEGYKFLADELTVIDLSGAEPRVLPFAPYQRLWEDAAGLLDIKGGRPFRGQSDSRRYDYRFNDLHAQEPRSVAAIFHLLPKTSGTGLNIAPFLGKKSVHAVLRSVSRANTASRLLGEEVLLDRCIKAAAASAQYAIRHNGVMADLVNEMRYFPARLEFR
ncbi:hypothetical protein FBZ89_14013 [Nitrospirillum amazonense]|uniref:Hpr(Ser) kinase/phosphatase n=1 Tax=Nitrospirillum amazonense TaxID=28077 RepID=A0A560EJV9_9PROT|nr:hypothetical protein [Nitrospirillum amazonense]TWB09668.1 hypothetical protein FBZ89_14013 [Nitrospirillum amazonense]